MEAEFVNLNEENSKDEHLCCIIRTKKPHPGVEAKRAWLAERMKEGHVFRKLNDKATVFIEYAPLETAWVPICGENYLYIYCLWVLGDFKGKGYGKALMEYCIKDAREKGKSGVCMLGAKKQKAWLSDQEFAKRFGFIRADETESGYTLLALSFDGTMPHFTERAKKERIEKDCLTVFYSPQCPYIKGVVQGIEKYCAENGVEADLVLIDSLKKAKAMPSPFNNFAVFYKGAFQTVNLLDIAAIKRILNK